MPQSDAAEGKLTKITVIPPYIQLFLEGHGDERFEIFCEVTPYYKELYALALTALSFDKRVHVIFTQTNAGKKIEYMHMYAES